MVQMHHMGDYVALVGLQLSDSKYLANTVYL